MSNNEHNDTSFDVIDVSEAKEAEMALVQVNPLKAALNYAHRDDEQLAVLRRKYLQVKEKPGMEFVSRQLDLKNHLPLEQAVINQAKEIHEPWDWERQNLARDVNLIERYKEFDPTPLTWRNRQGLPRLAVFDVASTKNDFTILGHPANLAYRNDELSLRQRSKDSIHIGGRSAANTSSYDTIASCYQDVVQKLYDRASEIKKTLVLQAKFTGLIPDEVRAQILDFLTQAGMFSSVFIIAEINHWDLREHDERSMEEFWRECRKEDLSYEGVHQLARAPLVVGQVLQLDRASHVIGSKLFLISFFDTTFLEDYLIEKTVQRLS